MKTNKTKIVTTRFGEDEYMELQVKVDNLNISFSDYLRQSAFNVNIYSKEDTQNIGMLISAINKMGNNVNQIAYVLNFAKKKDILDGENYENILDELIVIRETLRSFHVC